MTLLKPEYFFRPSQVMRRAAYALGITRTRTNAITPWGMPIEFDPDEYHGRAMLTLGLSDLRTNELISRIVRMGDVAIDVGANIGIMTSLMAKRAGSTGAVFAFEPHPNTRNRLNRNVARWHTIRPEPAKVTVLPHALSSKPGGGYMKEPDDFGRNSGVASLDFFATGDGANTHAVEVTTFDEWSRELNRIRLVKVDVEGHEDDVFAGMRATLSLGRIDFLIFEEMRALPSPACRILQDFGYTTYLIDRDFFKPVLFNTDKSPATLIGEATNILAARAGCNLGFLQRSGWTCLK